MKLLQRQPPRWSGCTAPNPPDDPRVHGLDGIVIEVNKRSASLQMPPYVRCLDVCQRSKGTECTQWGFMCALLTGHEHRSIEEAFGNLLGDIPDSIGNLAAFAFLGLIMDQKKKKKKWKKENTPIHGASMTPGILRTITRQSLPENYTSYEAGCRQP